VAERTFNPAVALIGPGRVGQAMGRLLAQSGVRIEWVAARRAAAARKAARFIGAGRVLTLDAPELARAQAFLITTSDSALGQVASSLASTRRDWRGAVVLHTSGAWPASGPASVLRPLRELGAATGSLHPLQTVPSREAGVRNLIGCYWALEGDASALRLARHWVCALQGTAVVVKPNRKGAYHAAAVISCAGVVTLMAASQRLLESSGVSPGRARRMLEGFVAETARSFARLGAKGALTGPAVRGDWATIRRHRAALQAFAPGLAPLYRELLRAMASIAGARPPKGV
jgi:predicted short-subunit dehydrogenase-like oxidoreductase (DUF2520 family)